MVAISPALSSCLCRICRVIITFCLLVSAHNCSKAVRKFVSNLISFPLTMKKRLRLGRQLGIPISKIESIELEASEWSSKEQQKKVALEKMMSYWFENYGEASVEKLADTLDKMNMDPQQTMTIRMLIWNATVEEDDIEDLRAMVGASHEVDNAWVNKWCQRVTWNKLVKAMDTDEEESMREALIASVQDPLITGIHRAFVCVCVCVCLCVCVM